MWSEIKGAFSIWSVLKGTDSSEIRRQAEMPINIIVIGDEETFVALKTRLGSPNAMSRIDIGIAPPETESRILLDGTRLLQKTEKEFDEALGRITIRHATRRIAIASAVPAFRSVIANQISHEWALKNAKFAALSALPGILPLTDFLLPVTSAGDLFLLTKNQIMLLLEVAACYGHATDPRARIKELLPVVGGAFGWRAIARELVGLVPGGVGVAVKAAVAYGGTYAVGRAALYYYSGNREAAKSINVREILKEALADVSDRGRKLLP